MAQRKLKKSLVTGGAGFVGSHLVNHLLAQGIDTVVLDDLSAGTSSNVPKDARFLQADIRDAAKVAEAIQGCDTVFHLAARIDLQKSILDPADCLSVNVAGTAAIVQAALKAKARMIFASSAAVYPLESKAALKESDAGLGDTPYALSKRASEQLLTSFARLQGLSAASIRCFNLYGPGQRMGSGYAAVIPKFITLAHAGQPLTVNGSGEQTRDFMHVSDMVACYYLAAQSDVCDIFNAGTGEATSVLKLAQTIQSFGGKSKIEFRPAQSGDAHTSLADLTHVRRALGFKAKVSLEDGLRDLYERAGK